MTFKKPILSLFFVFVCFSAAIAQNADPTLESEILEIGVVGLSHDHAHGILRRHREGKIKIIGIAESNRELAQRHADNYGFDMGLVYDSIDEMIEHTNPTVVSDYGSIYEHLKTVAVCAPRGIHVMVEKPLAVSVEHVRRMQKLVADNKIHLLTNYETTWYDSNHAANQLMTDQAVFGEIRRIVVHDGHRGPIEIGCSQEFVAWLTDPKLNGGGALTDFGCYGANLSTWLMNGTKPTTVTAVTQQIKPETYPNVDDDATIIVTYPHAQAILQASWNWNYNRKDLEIYGSKGYVICPNSHRLQIMRSERSGVKEEEAKKLSAPYDDPYAYLAAVVRGEMEVQPTDLSGLENNVTVVEILEAAKISAQESRTVRMDEITSK